MCSVDAVVYVDSPSRQGRHLLVLPGMLADKLQLSCSLGTDFSSKKATHTKA